MTDSTRRPVRVLVVEDHPVMRESICSLLEREPDLEVSGEAESVAAAIAVLDQIDADIALVDVSLPDASGIELADQLRRRHPGVVVVMLSGHQESSYVSQALEAGAAGYILKGQGTEIPEAMRRVLAGERYLSSGLRLSSRR